MTTVDISEETASALIAFSPWNPHNEHRAYFMAHNVLYDMAQDYFAEIEKPIIRLKGIYGYPTSGEKAKYSGRSPWFDNPQYYFPKWTKQGRSAVLDTKCEQWFHSNCKPMIEGMFRVYKWDGIGEAIEHTQNYAELCGIWDGWFEQKKERFMKKQNEVIKQTTGLPAKMPNSHGGVANLLKTLTKTMTLQGASIQSIAKVQYAICTQAGIYIPNEFLTDVAVALDYNERIENV